MLSPAHVKTLEGTEPAVAYLRWQKETVQIIHLIYSVHVEYFALSFSLLLLKCSAIKV